ncbi:MAG TPA: carboxymuconolactone decarboxylase family protein [Chitinophagaceae bacterium]|nr:carboxymuconolactone decarboxylase family protein [Chitinophagaceae bacterium]
MARLKLVSPETAIGKTKDLYSVIKTKLGVVPNMMQTMGNSSAFLEGYLNLNSALGSGKLGAKVGELIALTVAEINACNYCLSAHSYLGANLVKLDSDTMDAARGAQSSDRKIDAILKFAKAVVIRKGQVSDGDIAAVKEAGITEGEIAEIIGHVGLNILTNYFNTVANTAIDFPEVKAGTAVAA